MEVLNSCGRQVFQISDVERVKRFLSLGCSNGTYYICTKDLMQEHIECIECMLDDIEKRNILLELIGEYVKGNKCKKQEPLVYLLARCCTYSIGDNSMLEFRNKAYELLSDVCTTASTLMMFIDFSKKCSKKYSNSSGWNNLHKRAISKWYTSKDPFSLLFQMTKYKERNGYKHRDVLRLCHIVPSSLDMQVVFNYIVKETGSNDMCSTKTKDFIKDLEILKLDMKKNIIVDTINKWQLAREHLPNTWLNDKHVWIALLNYMPNIALLRNLNKMTLCGVFDDHVATDFVINKIENMNKVHPIQMLISLKMYAGGKGFKGNNAWIPVPCIIDAIDKRFYGLFKDVKKSTRRICVAIDVSPSMSWTYTVGTECMNAAEVSCGLAMVLKASNSDNIEIMGFTSNFVPLHIDPNKPFADNLRNISNFNFDSTDISKPFVWAQENKKHFDAFVVLTDSETNSNKIKPCDALRNYRKVMGVSKCKLVVVAMASNKFSIADPEDKYMLDIAGFDASVPDVIIEFIEETY